MEKRKREDGFTLIELMIVIAVIGILAVVLIPKVGTIKTQAKLAGVDTNMRTVDGYIQSRIDSWANANNGSGTNQATIAADIASAFTSTANGQVTNPLSGSSVVTNLLAGGSWGSSSGDAIDIYSADGSQEPYLAGTIVVVVPTSISANTPTTGITITEHDNNGRTMSDKNVIVTP